MEQLNIIQNVLSNFRWDLIILSGVCLINFVYSIKTKNKLKLLQSSQSEANKHLLELAGDVKALYESGATLGSKLKQLEYGSRLMKEEQEKLSLKEPSQQMYRNAVQQINNGESVIKISESSGLSRGEVELLKLFQKIEVEADTGKNKKAVSG